MKASILAVGTEITIGQIVNHNAGWISQKLNPLGITVACHLAVPDQRDLLANALTWIESQSDLLFITGGLGPTSDDFTRELVSEWCGKPLEFHEPSWLHIQRRLSARGFAVRDIQKQQCYYPTGSVVLPNSNGTANGFYLELENKKTKNPLQVFVLPGPPNEIEVIWNDNIDAKLKVMTAGIDTKVTKAWDTLGMGESDVALLVEESLNKHPVRDAVEIGYRVHMPYVEVKATYLTKNSAPVHDFIRDITQRLAGITVVTDFTDLAESTSQLLRDLDFTFYDFVSAGFLHRRLQPYLKFHPRWSWRQAKEAPPVDFFSNEENFMALLPHDDGQKMLFIYDYLGTKKQFIVESGFTSPLMLERNKQYFAEMALVKFNQRQNKD